MIALAESLRHPYIATTAPGGGLGIAVMGAILAARETSALKHGVTAPAAFVSGYAPALQIGAAVLLGGAVIATAALRQRRAALPVPALEPAA